MRAKENAMHAQTEDKIQDAIPRQGSNAAAHVDSANVEHPVIPPAKQSEETEEIPIAGRTKMTIPKNKDVQDSASSDSKPEDQEETAEYLEAKTELNSILKQSPGMLVFCLTLHKLRKLEANNSAYDSHNLFQVLLSL
jgi:hypothetical protein